MWRWNTSCRGAQGPTEGYLNITDVAGGRERALEEGLLCVGVARSTGRRKTTLRGFDMLAPLTRLNCASDRPRVQQH